jgi:hypothetical protein
VPEGIQLLSLEGIILVKYGPVLPVVKQKPQRQNNQHPRDQAFNRNMLQFASPFYFLFPTFSPSMRRQLIEKRKEELGNRNVPFGLFR